MKSFSKTSTILAACCAVALLATGCGDDGTTDPQDSLTDKAVEFMGGEAALRDFSGFELTATGTRSVLGEGPTPGGGAMEASTFEATVSYDLANDNMAIAYARIVGFLGGASFEYTEIYNGQLGYIDGIESIFGTGNYAMVSSRWASGRKQQELLNPHVLMLEVLADASVATEVETGVLEIDDAVHPIRLHINAETGQINRATTLINDFLTRDTELEVTYDGWQEQGGIMFPDNVTISLDGEVIHTETRGAVTVNATFATDAFDIPGDAMAMYDDELATWGEESHQFFQAFASIAITLDAPQYTVVATELETGIWHLTGGSHNSMAVEQENGVVIVEAPLYPERSDAILEWAATQFPGKPVTHVIATHHHEDHSAGLRSFVSAGATVVVQESAQAFLRDEVFAAASTVVPDTLSRTPMDPVFELVPAQGSVTLDDATNPIIVYHMDAEHANDMTLVYVASQNDVVFESDMYNPGNGGQAINPVWAMELLTAITTLDGGLGAPLLVGGHGATAPLQELIDFLAALP